MSEDTPPVRNVVLVHGIHDRGSKMAFIQRDLEEAGFCCLAPSLEPWDGSDGLEDLAGKLKREIGEAFGEDAPIAMVGFSMGGIISRYYLQCLGGSSRCQIFVTISAPHHGTVMARFGQGHGVRQMRRGSEFLKQLNADPSAYENIPVLSWWTPLDLMILPATSSIWDVAENHMDWQVAHPLMVFSRRVRQDILRRLIALDDVG